MSKGPTESLVYGRFRIIELSESRWLDSLHEGNAASSQYIPVGNRITSLPINLGDVADQGEYVQFDPIIEIIEAGISPCVHAFFRVKFKFSDDVPVGAGRWVVQQIRTRLRVRDCSCKDITRTVPFRKCPETLYEAFDVSRPFQVLFDDEYTFDATLRNTKGVYEVEGRAIGLANWTPPPEFGNNHPGCTGFVPSTVFEPEEWERASANAALHKMRVEWDCCAKPNCALMYTTPSWASDLPLPVLGGSFDCPRQIPLHRIIK